MTSLGLSFILAFWFGFTPLSGIVWSSLPPQVPKLLIQHQCLVLFSQRTTGLSSKLYHKIAPRHAISPPWKERGRAITQEFKSEKKKGKHMLSFKILKLISEVTSSQTQLQMDQMDRGTLTACPLRKENPVVNTICTSKNI